MLTEYNKNLQEVKQNLQFLNVLKLMQQRNFKITKKSSAKANITLKTNIFENV